MRKRIRTGIVGVDSMLDGGIPEGSQVVLAGGPGSGKTLLSFEFLYKGAKAGEVGVMFSFEEESGRLIENVKDAFSDFTDIDQLIADKKLVIYGSEETKPFVQKDSEQASYALGKIISELQNRIEATKAKRVVIDSMSFVRLFIKDDFDYRALSISLLNVLNRENATTIVTIEMESQEKADLRFPQEFFVYDGLILLYFGGRETENRMPLIEVMKMRGTRHIYTAIPYEVTSHGINVLAMS